MSQRLLAVVLPPVLALALATSVAQAQEQDNAATAQALFDAGRVLTEKGDWAAACPKLAESYRLDPGIGTLYRLADCYEHVGRLATAWAEFVEVADKASLKGQTERASEGQRRAKLLEPRLARLTVQVSNTVPDLVVKRDGAVVGSGQWGIAVPVDPGVHTIIAEAPGRTPWTHTETFTGEGTSMTVTVPALEATATPSVPSEPTQPIEHSGGHTLRTAGIVVGAVGLVGLGLGTYFGLQSISKHNQYTADCMGSLCTAPGISIHDDAVTAGNISTVAFAVGAAALVGGVVMIVVAPKGASQTGLRIGPMVGGAAGNGLLMRGAW